MIAKRWILAAGFALVAALAPLAAPQAAQAEVESDVIAVVALPAYDNLLAEVGFIGKLMERPGLPAMIEGGLSAVTQGKGLAGLDRTKPWGAIVKMAEGADEPEVLAFVPVSSLKKLLGAFSNLTGGPVQPNDEGIYEIEAGPRTIYIKEQKGWAFISKDAASFESLPADPTKVFEGLDKQYDIGVRFYARNLPEDKREQAIAELKEGLQSGLQRLPDETDEEFESRKEIAENSMENLVQMMNETDHLTFGWQIDSEKGSTHIDFSLVAIEGSDLAKQAAQMKETNSDFLGFLSDTAAVKASLKYVLSEDRDIEQMSAMVEALRTKAMDEIENDADLDSDEDREELRGIVSDFIDVLKETVEAGTLDGGLSVFLKPGALTAAVGGHVENSKKLEASFKRLAELAEGQPGFKGVEWDADEHEGVKFHTMSVEVEDEEEREVLGNPLEVVLGIGKDSFYIAFGKNSLATLKKVIDQSAERQSEKVPSFQLAAAVGKIVEFAAAQKDDPMAAAIAESLKDSEGADHVRITLKSIKNGAMYRIEAEKGVLEAIGKAAAASGAGNF